MSSSCPIGKSSYVRHLRTILWRFTAAAKSGGGILRYSEEMEGIISAWGRILGGYTPALSIEITRECPLRCPGCYAYGDDHLGGELTLREVRDFKGQELIDGLLALVDKHRPLHL